jgi:hypothetical protein
MPTSIVFLFLLKSSSRLERSVMERSISVDSFDEHFVVPECDMRAFAIYDNNGYLLQFGQSL